jgi:ATP-dependent exoDNAse (exonuclease V) beta subunit
MPSPIGATAQTPDAALFDPTRSWVVTAGAGTGKTWRLVRRYLSCLKHLHDLGQTDEAQRILAVTFTRAAAAEMRVRVLQALQSGAKPEDPLKDPVVAAAQGWPETLRRDLLRQVASAPIDTIHAFCARLLGAFPELSGVVPGVRPIEPDEDALRRERFLRAFLDPALDQPDHELARDLSILLGEFSLTDVRSMVATVVCSDQEVPEELGAAPGVAAVRTNLYEPALSQVAADVQGHLAAALEAFVSEGGNDGRRQLTEGLIAAVAQRDFDLALELLRNQGPNRGTGLKSDGSACEPLKNAVNTLKNGGGEFRGARGTALVSETVETVHCQRLARVLHLGLAARQAYAEHLASQGLMRFDDLERRTEILLGHPQAAAALAGRYAQLLVDEYQDTSPRQVRILKALEAHCSSTTQAVATFKVGDLKQSIYRFRGAEVSVFRKTLQDVPGHQRGTLVETYRTRPDLAHAFNHIFPRLLEGITGELPDQAKVPWNQSDAIVTHKADSWLPGLPIQLMLMCKTEKKAKASKGDGQSVADEGATETEEAANEVDAEAPGEAAKVATWIHGYLERAHQAYQALPEDAEHIRRDSQGKQAEPLQPKDFAILLPKWGEAETFRQALQQVGIAAQISGGRGLKARPEIRDLANLVAFLADPTDNVAAAGVLRGPLAGISDLGLYVLARWPGVKRRLHSSVVEWSGSGEPDQPLLSARPMHQVARNAVLDAQVAAAALVAAGTAEPTELPRIQGQLAQDAVSLERLQTLLSDLQERAGLEPTADVLTRAVHSQRLPQIWAAQPEPERVLANVWRIIELIRGVEADGPDLQAVLAWLDGDADPTPEGLIDPAGDAVTITTVHGAKGLEWRVVVLAGLHQQLRSGSQDLLKLDPVSPLHEHEVDPLLAKLVPRLKIPGAGFARDDDPLQALATTLDSGLAAAEVKRLLYVGLTRASDRVVLSGALKVSKVLTKRAKDAPDQPGLAPELAWRTLEQCSQTAQMLVSVLRLCPNQQEDPTHWVTQSEAAPEELRGAVGLCAVFDSKLDDDAQGQRAPASLEPAPPAPTTIAVDHLKPSQLPRDLWTPLTPPTSPAPDPATRIGVPWGQDREMDDNAAGSQLGLVLHGAMEHWGCRPEQFPSEQVLRRLAIQHVPSGADLPLEWLTECLRRLQNSPLGAEMAAAAQRGELYHEVPLDALLTTNHGPALLSGRIDALFRDDQGQWVVVDYKLTQKAEPAKLIATYGAQLQAYRAALESAGMVPVGRVGLWTAAFGVAVWG